MTKAAPALFFKLQKVDVEKRLVYGIATGESVDKSGEICDYETTKPYYKAWSDGFRKATGGKSYGNMRVMHQPIVAGPIKEITYDDDAKTISICGKVVADDVWKMILEGGYTGFSQGGGYVKTWFDPEDDGARRYTADPGEISIVDNPCFGPATFEVIKADGSTELRKFNSEKKELSMLNQSKADDLEQVWKAKNGTTWKTKKEATDENVRVDAEALAKDASAGANDLLDDMAKRLGDEPAKDDKATVIDEPAKIDDVDASKVFATLGPEFIKALLGAIKKNVGIKKSLHDVGRAACLIQELQWMHGSLEFESAIEGDASAAPDHLKSIIGELCAFLVALVAEETQEILGGDEAEVVEVLAMAAKMPQDSATALVKCLDGINKAFGGLGGTNLKAELKKAGARHSKADLEHLKTMKEHVGKMSDSVDKMKDCVKGMGMDDDADKKGDDKDDAEKTELRGELAKSVANSEALTKTISDLTTKFQGVVDRITNLEKQDAVVPNKPQLFTLAKNHEPPKSDKAAVEDNDLKAIPDRVSPMDWRGQK